MQHAIDLAERNLVPDLLVRAGMRRVIGSWLRTPEARDPERAAEAVRQFVAGMRSAPIAAAAAMSVQQARQRARLAITVASLTLGGAVFMAVISLQTSLGTTLDRSLEFFGFDVQTSVTAPARAEALVAAAERVPETEAAEPWLVQPAQLERPDGFRLRIRPSGGEDMLALIDRFLGA